ncbi:MAG: MFS transporter [Chloroflexi bacterium]|nr:MFS transporter [Chloroflexota bacterium]
MTDSRNWKVPFFTIWIGQAVSLVGSHLVRFALVWWLTEVTGSAVALATATTMFTLPSIFLGPFAGVLIDRLPRKWVLIISDGSVAVFTAILSLLFWLDVAQPWHVFAIIFLRAIGDTFQNPAMMSTTPLMVPKDQYQRVAGMNATLFGITAFAVPPLGAALLGVMGVRGVLPLDVITAVAALLPLVFIPIPQPEKTPDQAKGTAAVLHDLSEGLRYIWNWKGMRWFMLTTLIWGVFMTPMFSFQPLLVTQHFKGGSVELGWLSSGFGVGMLVGGAILSAWGGFPRRIATSIVGTVVTSLGRLAVGLTPPGMWPLAIAGQFVAGLGFAAHTSGMRAAEQAAVDPKMQGRFFAVSHATFTGLTPISLAIFGPLADTWGVRPFWFLMPAAGIVLAIVRRGIPSIYRLEDAGADGRDTVRESPGLRPVTAILGEDVD